MDTAGVTFIPDADDLTDQLQRQVYGHQYFIKVSPGKKKFAPKVRSGCLTCKRRRVKCDEAQPSCNRCLRMGHTCEGYQIPQAWIFKASRDDKGVTHAEERPGSSSSSDLEKSSPIHGVSHLLEDVNLQDFSIINTPPDLAAMRTTLFPDDITSQRVLEFYMLNTARSLDAVSYMGSCWLIWVPRLAYHFTSIRHLMLATSLFDQSMRFPTALPPLDRDEAREIRTQALSQYQVAISALLRDQHPTIVLILAALIACGWEMALGNPSAAKIHADAAAKLNADTPGAEVVSSRYWSEMEADIRRIVPLFVDMCKLRNSAEYESRAPMVTDPPQPLHPQPLTLTSLNESLALVYEKISRYCATSEEADSAIEFQAWLLRWETASIAYCPQESETQAQKEATHLFWFVGLAVLPEYITGSHSYTHSPLMVELVLKKARTITEQEIEAHSEVSDLVKRALEWLLSVITNQFPDTVHAKEAEELTERLNQDPELWALSS